MSEILQNAMLKQCFIAVSFGVLWYNLCNIKKKQRKNLFVKNIHTDIGDIIAEYKISDNFDKYKYKQIQTVFNNNFQSWYFDLHNFAINDGLKKLKQTYPNIKINLDIDIKYPYYRYVIIKHKD